VFRGPSKTAAAFGRARKVERARRPTFSGLLDRHVLRSLGWSFTVAFVVLAAIFLIFTLFELLRFIAVTGASAGLVARYLLFLLPLVGVALAPMSLLVAVLVVYALMARRSEAIAWWASGQSVYRLALPGLFFAFCVGGGAYAVQENLMPESNRRQDALRAQIRGGVARAMTNAGRQWLAASDARQIYSYEYDERAEALRLPVVYEFDAEGVHLQRLVTGRQGRWVRPGVLEIGEEARVTEMRVAAGGSTRSQAADDLKVLLEAEGQEVFKPTLNKPSQMDIKQLSAYIKVLKRRGDTSSIAPLAVALERKRADPWSPLVMALTGIPLALAFGRRSAITALCCALLIGLAFWAATSGFQQLGAYGLLPAPIAAWAPPTVFAAAGVYLLFRART
jgi:LPS export ABC transporter permease LptG